MEGHHQDGKNCSQAFIFFFSLYEQLLILQWEAERNKDPTPGYWPVQQRERRRQQTAMYQEKAISANCVTDSPQRRSHRPL